MKFLVVALLISLAVLVDAERPKRAINPFLDSMGKRAVNPFLDSFGKRSVHPYFMNRIPMQKRYFDSLAGQSLGKRSAPFEV